jgi:pyruvate dehydrogenase E1 component alpha subunit
MEYTAISEVIAVEHPAADRASAYGLEGIIVDGNDADAVYEVATAAYERARSGNGPSLIEALTYRHKGHSRADPGKYRPDEEVEEWLKRDPLDIYRERLLSLGVAEETLNGMEAAALSEVEAATEASKNAPPPDPAVLLTDVWADGGSSWRN